MKILLTGGTGSFGRYATQHILNDFGDLLEVDELRIFSRDEEKQIAMKNEFNSLKLSFIVGNVRDFEALADAMYDVDIVIHAAALKQIPTCEIHPLEAIKTNLEGTKNVKTAAMMSQVRKAVFLSTDKAVQPVNIYGATKMLAERLWLHPEPTLSNFAAVRYGNIIRSRGSVIPLFERQAKEKQPLTVTHIDMTRFFITLANAFAMVAFALTDMTDGAVYVPKLKSCRIIDLAKILAGNDYPIRYSGVRRGEKLHETLVSEDEWRRTEDNDKYYLIHPEGAYDSGRVGETYNSRDAERLTREEIQQMLADDWECGAVS